MNWNDAGFEGLKQQEDAPILNDAEAGGDRPTSRRGWVGVLAGFAVSMLVGLMVHKRFAEPVTLPFDVTENEFVSLSTVNASEWEGYGPGTVCRNKDEGRDANLVRGDPGGSAMLAYKTATEDACKIKCQDRVAAKKLCSGIEYQNSTQRCEIWVAKIMYTLNLKKVNAQRALTNQSGTVQKLADDFQCSVYKTGLEETVERDCSNISDAEYSNATDTTQPCYGAAQAANGSADDPALKKCIGTAKLNCCLKTALNDAAIKDCCSDPLYTGADTAQCKPCHASGTDCRDNGKCCDKSTTCYWKNEHWADCKASCNRGTFDPNSPVEHRAPWSCHPWGTCATPATLNCEFEPYGGHCCNFGDVCYYINNKTGSQCKPKCDDVRRDVSEGPGDCEAVPQAYREGLM